MRVVGLALLLVPSVASAGTLRVGPGQTYSDLGAAVAAATAGDTVLVDPGTYAPAATVQVGKALTIQANGAGVVVNGTAIDVFTAVAGANLTLQGLVIHPTGGRGLRVSGGTVRVIDVEISGNTAQGNTDGGAILVAGGQVTIDGAWLHDDTARKSGGSSGGCLGVTGGTVTVTDTRFERCKGNDGGAVGVLGGTVTIDGSTFSSCEAGPEPYQGGAIFTALGSDVTVTDSTFTANKAFEGGGAVYAEGAVTLRGNRFQDNVAGNAGAVLYVSDYGGAVELYCDDATSTCPRAVFEDNFLEGNEALVTGGGLYLRTRGPSRVVRNVFCANVATDAGGLYVTSVATSASVLNNVFAENVASNTGGGVWCNSGAVGVSMVNNDFLGNSAGSNGAALEAPDCTMAFKNNVIEGHSGTAFVASASGPVDYNVWFDNDTGISGRSYGANDLRGSDPRLNGWSSDGSCANDDWTPGAGSPVFDRGDPALKDRDGSRSDVGVTGGTESLLLTDDDNDGVPAGRDCDDHNPAVAPGRPELCNGVDEDCDGVVDGPAPATAPLFYRDADGDGHGTPTLTQRQCSQQPGWSALADDCNDAVATVFPGATELCNGIDDDCDTLVDGADAADLPAWYPDRDGDGHGRSVADPERACTGSAGTVALGDDCDDGNALIAPGMPEHCDGVDEDCDGNVDDDPVSALVFHEDADGDGWGDANGKTRRACRAREGFAYPVGDCNDADPDVHPAAPEPCDPPRDMNCDGAIGQDDHDSDGFPACRDCDDFDSSSKPGAADAWYDGRIQDCTRTSDFDQDADGFDAATYGGEDCDDTSTSVHPGAIDVGGDSLDADCDGVDGTALGGDTDAGDTGGEDDTKVACKGCATGSTGLPLPLLLGLAAAIRRRRR